MITTFFIIFEIFIKICWTKQFAFQIFQVVLWYNIDQSWFAYVFWFSLDVWNLWFGYLDELLFRFIFLENTLPWAWFLRFFIQWTFLIPLAYKVFKPARSLFCWCYGLGYLLITKGNVNCSCIFSNSRI